MKNKFLKWHQKEHSKRQGFIGTVIDAMLFGLAIPMGMFLISHMLDTLLSLPQFTAYLYTQIIGISLMIFGTVFWAWSVFSFFKEGKGSSLPIIPTKKLVTMPPYNYCRNPITFGALLYYFGFGILVGSFSLIGFNILLIFLVILYLKLIEETELEERFGKEYIKYKERTPFLIPWPRVINK